MNTRVMKIVFPCAVFLLLITFYFVFHRQAKAEAAEKVSEFGNYQGYSEAIYDGSKRSSDYLALPDGTRLAYDLFLPTKDGVTAGQPLPVLFKYTPYDRAWTVFDKDGNVLLCELLPVWYCEPMLRTRAWFVSRFIPGGNGKIRDAVARTPWVGEMLNSGYAVIVVERPGTGASFGVFNGDPKVAAGETDEILNWIAAQEWCDGNIGMFGDSIQAQIQFLAASTGNPHLKAILPATTWMDNYSAVMFPGGILDKAMVEFYVKANNVFDAMATPVDQDTDGTLLAQARAERNATVALSRGVALLENFPYRDSLALDGQNYWMTGQTLYPLLEKINRSGVPVYLINGWYDIYARDNFLIYENLTVPKRLLVRPTDHAGIEESASDIDYAAEAHRWFDYWLKGIDNGIMEEPPIHYYLQEADKGQEWQSSYDWPVKDQAMTRYYFGPKITPGKASLNNGVLTTEFSTMHQAFDAYTVDYSTTTGTSPLWTGLAAPHEYPDMRTNDSKALTYSTPTLEKAITVVGHPIVHIWLSSDAPDLDTFVYIEEVAGNGKSTYITEGVLRASHRQLSQAPFDNLELPWHNHFQSELTPIPKGEPFELVFDLRPTAWHFTPGKQIRVTIAFADAGTFETPILDPAPSLELFRDAVHSSYIELPIVQSP
jgi:uncharacterized protein